MIPAVSAGAYTAARERAAFVERGDRGGIVVSGADRASYLQGLLTNDIAALKTGEGCYAAYLTAQGRMIADMYVYELGDVILLTLDGGVKDAADEDIEDDALFARHGRTLGGGAGAALLSSPNAVDADRLPRALEVGGLRMAGGPP